MIKLLTIRFNKLIKVLLIISLFHIISCSYDSSITDNNDQSVGKITEPIDINTPQSDDYIEVILNKYGVNFVDVVLIGSLCLYAYIEGFKLPEIPEGNDLQKNESNTYDFRDNFLLKTEKGKYYTAFYYLLSDYGIENNLVMKYSMEHLSLMNTGIEVSQVLQHGTNDNQILIKRSTYDDLKDMLTIYRESDNHTDIDVVLDFLENDLEKYYNKTKSQIAADFGF